MSRISLVISLVLVLSAALSAQTTKGRTGSSLSPSTSTGARSSDRSSGSPSSSGRSSATSTPRATTPTTTYGNAGPVHSPNTTYMRPADTRTSRPATYAPPTTAKGATPVGAKATTLKPADRGVVNWMSLEEALEKSKVEKRKIFIDMYTDWCGWCKHMDSTTFVNGAVARYLNEHYYPVKFNAEQEKDIVFKDKTYHFKKSGNRGYHELAAFWLNNRLSFPTVVFLDENQQLIQSVPSYQDAAKMEAIINYFGTDSHKKTPWESYEKSFKN